MIKDFIKKLKFSFSLEQNEIQNFVDNVVFETPEESELEEVVELLGKRSVNPLEMFYFVKAMRKHAICPEICSDNVVDICGTGADNASTFNISTASAIVAASLGVNVVKQTNSCITSECGSSDFLEALKIKIFSTPDEVEKEFQNSSIAFLHSPSFNRFAKIMNPVRHKIGIRTLLNFTGPLINPVFPKNQVIGVSDLKMAEVITEVLKMLGLNRAYVVHGIEPKLDELSVCSDSYVFELNNDKINKFIFNPEDLGIKKASLLELRGATPLYNANLVTEIFEGKYEGAKVDIIALNAALMLLNVNMTDSFKKAVVEAYEAIISGKALKKLRQLQSYCEAKV